MGIDWRTGRILLRERREGGREARSESESLMRAEDERERENFFFFFFFTEESCSVTYCRGS